MLLLLREPAPERNRAWSGDRLNSLLYLIVALYYSFFSYTRDKISPLAGLETNARPLARGELNSVRASGSSDLTSPVGEWIFYFFYFLFFLGLQYYYDFKRDDKVFKFYDVMG